MGLFKKMAGKFLQGQGIASTQGKFIVTDAEGKQHDLQLLFEKVIAAKQDELHPAEYRVKSIIETLQGLPDAHEWYRLKGDRPLHVIFNKIPQIVRLQDAGIGPGDWERINEYQLRPDHYSNDWLINF